MSKPLEVPANYFGKGVDYVLPDDPKEVLEFQTKWEQWEAANPNDPTGERALAAYLQSGFVKAATQIKEAPVVGPKTYLPVVSLPIEIDEDESAKLRLQLPKEIIAQLKQYAKYKRRHPRDIIIGWIKEHCKL